MTFSADEAFLPEELRRRRLGGLDALEMEAELERRRKKENGPFDVGGSTVMLVPAEEEMGMRFMLTSD